MYVQLYFILLVYLVTIGINGIFYNENSSEVGRILRLGGPKKFSGAGCDFFAQIFDVIFFKHELILLSKSRMLCH